MGSAVSILVADPGAGAAAWAGRDNTVEENEYVH